MRTSPGSLSQIRAALFFLHVFTCRSRGSCTKIDLASGKPLCPRGIPLHTRSHFLNRCPLAMQPRIFPALNQLFVRDAHTFERLDVGLLGKCGGHSTCGLHAEPINIGIGGIGCLSAISCLVLVGWVCFESLLCRRWKVFPGTLFQKLVAWPDRAADNVEFAENHGDFGRQIVNQHLAGHEEARARPEFASHRPVPGGRNTAASERANHSSPA